MFIPSSGRTCIADTVEFFPQQCQVPKNLVIEAIATTLRIIRIIIHNNTNTMNDITRNINNITNITNRISNTKNNITNNLDHIKLSTKSYYKHYRMILQMVPITSQTILILQIVITNRIDDLTNNTNIITCNTKYEFI